MKCTDILIQDHKIILRALDILEQMAARTEKRQPVEPEDVETLLRFLRSFADDHHQVKEECALFPELMRTSLANDGRLRQMAFEHDQERFIAAGPRLFTVGEQSNLEHVGIRRARRDRDARSASGTHVRRRWHERIRRRRRAGRPRTDGRRGLPRCRGRR